jgi:hypothetical protein
MKNGSMEGNEEMNTRSRKMKILFLIKTMSPYHNFQLNSSSNPFESFLLKNEIKDNTIGDELNVIGKVVGI